MSGAPAHRGTAEQSLTRSRISCAALFVKVTARMLCGGNPALRDEIRDAHA